VTPPLANAKEGSGSQSLSKSRVSEAGDVGAKGGDVLPHQSNGVVSYEPE